MGKRVGFAGIPVVLGWALLASCNGGGGGETPLPRVTDRVNVSSAGAQADAAPATAGTSLSADGRYAVFVSTAGNLVEGDDVGSADLFLRDTVAGTTTRIGQNALDFPRTSLSADGRFAACVLTGQLVVLDLATSTSITAAADAFGPSISADGRFLAFSTVSPLVAEDTNGVSDIYVFDVVAQAFERVSVATGGGEAGGGSDWPAISGDGLRVAFRSFAADLVGGDLNGAPDVFVHDRVSGATVRASVNTDGSEMTGIGSGNAPALSYDGRYISFHFESFFTTDPGLHFRDLESGVTTSLPLIGIDPSLSADGRFLVFRKNPADGEAFGGVFIRDAATGGIGRLDYSAAGGAPNGASRRPVISADGTWIAFESDATDLLEGDTNGVTDIFRMVNPLL